MHMQHKHMDELVGRKTGWTRLESAAHLLAAASGRASEPASSVLSRDPQPEGGP